MIRKAQLLNENEKLKREVFIWIHIGVGTNSSVKEKEIAVKSFLEANPNFNSYEVCNTIELVCLNQCSHVEKANQYSLMI